LPRNLEGSAPRKRKDEEEREREKINKRIECVVEYGMYADEHFSNLGSFQRGSPERKFPSLRKR
jgi:hypothetical protein